MLAALVRSELSRARKQADQYPKFCLFELGRQQPSAGRTLITIAAKNRCLPHSSAAPKLLPPHRSNKSEN